MPDLPEHLRQALAGRYDLEAVVGRGGMATVYRAREVKHGRTVAVKVLRSDLGELIGPDRFLREIEIAARLMHPHILPLYDSGRASGPAGGTDGDVLYYVMPYVADESLRGLLSRIRLMDRDGAVEIIRRLASALDYAHASGILHRDIKPENILLPGGQAVLTDFGIAKAVSSAAEPANLTRTGIALGTPGYMSPEQAAGLVDLTRATDVYSLGVVAYEMLVGGLPRTWVTPDLLAAGRFLEAAPDHRALLNRLPPGTERALVRALALRSEQRYPAAGEFAQALANPETVGMPAVPLPAVSREPAWPPAGTTSAAPPARTSATAPTTTPGFLGAPTRIVVERIVPGLLPSDEHEYLFDEIRAALGHEGYGTASHQTLIWTARKPKKLVSAFDFEQMWESAQDEGPNIAVRIFARHGQTRIQLEQRLGETAGGIFGGIWGGAGGGGTAVLLGVGIPLGASVLVIPGAALVLGGTYAISRVIFRSVVATKARILEDLADRLAEQCAEAVGR
ncbi:MAG TPA: protein kinase [Gemmatimonadales bacterium]